MQLPGLERAGMIMLREDRAPVARGQYALRRAMPRAAESRVSIIKGIRRLRQQPITAARNTRTYESGAQYVSFRSKGIRVVQLAFLLAALQVVAIVSEIMPPLKDGYEASSVVKVGVDTAGFAL